MKGSGAANLRAIDRDDGGVGWIAHPDEAMQRASHALVGDDGGVWVFDPVDAGGVDDLLGEYGDVAGVVVGLDRHRRDAATLATRHGVAVHAPQWMDNVSASEFDAPLERFEGEVGNSGIRALQVRDSLVPPWQEAAFHHPDSGTAYVPESVGAAEYFLTDGERLGVHPMLRLFPPRTPLSRLSPDAVRVGHGAGVEDDAAAALSDALANSRGRAPALYAKTARQFLG